MRKALSLLALLPLLPTALWAAQQAAAANPWAPWQFLIGDWVAEGGGAPGQATGNFSFRPDLQGKILVRRNQADYPPSGGRPASHHEDLMVIYPETGGKSFRAVYFDNEGHVIHYTVVFAGASTIRFVSEAAAGAPRFRLTYRKTGEETITVKFEMAPPGKPEAFSTYVQGVARRNLDVLHSRP